VFVMAAARRRRPRLLDVLVSILIDPRGTTNDLLNWYEGPPHVIACLFLFCSAVIAPPLLYQPDETLSQAAIVALYATLLTTLLTLALTTCFVTMLFRALRLAPSIEASFAALVYSSAPIITLMGGMYLTNYLMEGNLSILQFLSTGYTRQNDWLLQMFPNLFKIFCLLSFIVFANCIRAIYRSSVTSAGLIAAVCIPLMLGSFIVALSLTEVCFAGSSEQVIAFFRSFVGR
jgi:hypothetical protein